MDTELTDDQELFRETTARFAETECPISTVRALVDDPLGHDPAVLRAAAELGWFSLFVPEEHGGGSVSGSPVADAAIVAEERGRRVQPGPFLGSNLVAHAIARAGSEEQRRTHLPGIADGSVVAAWAVSGGDGVPVPGPVTAVASGDGWRLRGLAGLVVDGAAAGLVLVSAAGEDGVGPFLVPVATPGVSVAARSGLDLTRRFAEVRFDDVTLAADARLGAPVAAPASVDRLVDVAAALVVAESVGAMDALVGRTVQYAKDRIAFGRPIGSFQAIKHVLADASAEVERSKAVAVAATRAVAEERATASEIASIAKAYVGDAGVAVAQACFQVHGGIGFTWEHDLHLYLRRLTSNRALFGDPDWHRERICRLHGL